MRTLKRLGAPVAAAVLLASAVLFIQANPAAADPSDGIDVDEYVYVDESDTWFDDIINADVKPEIVVLNKGDDIGQLDERAQALRAEGIKVFGYVNVCSANCGTTYRTLLSTYDFSLLADLWIDPFAPDRNNDDQFVDGIFIDQVPRDCGPIETPTNNTANDSDYVYRMSSYADWVNDEFDFWDGSWGGTVDGLTMANVGTAVRGCQPGWVAYGPVPDYYVTAENDYSTYAAGWAGGNIITGGTFGTTYELGSGYGAKFRHIVHDAATMAEQEHAIDLADLRGAGGVAVTDDVLANPYDAQNTYRDGAMAYAALSPLQIRYDQNNDYITTQTGANNIGVLRETYEPNCDNPGTPGTVERCLFPTDGLTLTYEVADLHCGPGSAVGGSWGTVDTGLGTPPNATLVNCMKDLVLDGTGRDDIGVVCLATTHIREWPDEDPNQDEADCQDTDGSGVYSVGSSDTTIIREVFFSTYARTEKTLAYSRDRANQQVNESGSTRHVNCVIASTNLEPSLHWNCP